MTIHAMTAVIAEAAMMTEGVDSWFDAPATMIAILTKKSLADTYLMVDDGAAEMTETPQDEQNLQETPEEVVVDMMIMTNMMMIAVAGMIRDVRRSSLS